MYDENGEAFGFNYNGNDYYYVRNAQNYVIAIVNSNNETVATYRYNSWGKLISCEDTSENQEVSFLNPYTYRSYFYDSDTEMYFLKSRYYNPELHRFINADSVVAGVGRDILGYNLFSYCLDNPINMSDITGNWPKWIMSAANWVNNNIITPIKNLFSPPKQNNVVNSSSNNTNNRPFTGEPGSTYTAPNGDKRTYGPDGFPEHDYDHSDHGRPDKHPHDSKGGHNHDWKNGVRGPAYSLGWETAVGVALVTVCLIGIVIVAADDITVIGVADDFLFGPLGAGATEGMILIFE